MLDARERKRRKKEKKKKKRNRKKETRNQFVGDIFAISEREKKTARYWK